MYIQRLYLYMIMTKPTKRLVLSYAKVDNEGKSIRPAYLIAMVTKLFPKLEIERPQLRPIVEQIDSPADGLSYLVDFMRQYAADEIGEERQLFFTLYDAYVRNQEYAPIVEQMRRASFSYLKTLQPPAERTCTVFIWSGTEKQCKPSGKICFLRLCTFSAIWFKIGRA